MERRTTNLPEGPEIKHSRDILSQIVVGRRINNVIVLGGRYLKKQLPGLTEFTARAKNYQPNFNAIENVSCKGKFLWFDIVPGWKLWCTYGMSGQWNTKPHPDHCSVALTHARPDGTDVQAIYFNDPRRFGTLKFVHDTTGQLTSDKLYSLGPDMLSDRPPTHDEFVDRLMRFHIRTIAEALMNQSCVSGVGNYIKAESLYSACISPHRVVDTLTPDELERLRTSIIEIMRASYLSKGATISTYRDPDGEKGSAQFSFKVYGKKNDPLGNPVVKDDTADKRTSWWCPAVQT